MDTTQLATALMCMTLAFYATGILPGLLEKHPGPVFLVGQLLAFFGVEFGIALAFYDDFARSLWLSMLAAVLATLGGITIKRLAGNSRRSE